MAITLGKRGRGLDPAVMTWLMTTLGIGPGLGDVHFLCEADSAYYSWLRDDLKIASEKVHFELAVAESALTPNRNDVLCVYPGDYTTDAAITWAKSQTHMIGLGGKNQRYQPSTLTEGGLRFKCTEAAVECILEVSGHYVQMHNFGTQNTASNAGNDCDILVSGKNGLFKNVHMRGGTGANQINANIAGVGMRVDGDTAGAGNGLLVEDCTLGSSGNTVRTAGAGCLVFSRTSPAAMGFGIHFNRCTFSMYSATAAAFAVEAAGSFSFDRELLFKDCFFYNYGATDCTNVFSAYDSSNTTIELVRCTMRGFTYWATAGYDLWMANGPANIGVGGKHVVVANT